MINKILLEKKINYLKEEINKIESMDFTMEDVLENEDIQDILDRRMQKAIESCIDIAAHIAAGLELPRKEYASDIFLLLGKRGIISKRTANKFPAIVGLRNILVHEYTEIDYKLAYSDLSQKLNDLKRFSKEVLLFLQRN